MGCGLGEIAGFSLATALGWANVTKIAVSVVLGYVFGMFLAVQPLRKTGLRFAEAFRIVFLAESVSITAMETAEVLAEIHTPGVMMAGIHEPVFWLGMGLALVAGFVAAYPVNFFLIRSGLRSHH
jgi:hypothetical protein